MIIIIWKTLQSKNIQIKLHCKHELDQLINNLSEVSKM